MKNRGTAALIVMTCIFISFTLGFLCGRTTSPAPVILSPLAAVNRVYSAAPVTTESAPTDPPGTLPPAHTTAVPAPSGTAGTAQENTGLININTATAAQLESLPGIGPVLAQRIIDYRQTEGPFKTLAQLTCVKGIGEKKLMAIIDLITI